jgi:hypothetical protein
MSNRVGEWTTRPPFVRRITVMRCHSGIPPNRIGISWSQILTPRDRNIALVSRFPVAQRDDGGTCSRNGRIQESSPLRSPALPTHSNSCQRSLGPPAKKASNTVKVAFGALPEGLSELSPAHNERVLIGLIALRDFLDFIGDDGLNIASADESLGDARRLYYRRGEPEPACPLRGGLRSLPATPIRGASASSDSRLSPATVDCGPFRRTGLKS